MSKNSALALLLLGLLISGCMSDRHAAGLAIVDAFEGDRCRTDWRDATTEDDRLWVAARCGSLESVKSAIASGANIHYRRSWYYTLSDMTPLHMAALEGHTEIVALLLKRGADPKATNPDLFTPLHGAARRGRLDAAVLLLRAGANPNAVDRIFGTPLHEAVQRGHPKHVSELLEAGASPNSRDRHGRTPLHMIGWNTQFERGHEEAIDLLLAAGADRNLLNDEGLTPLDYVIRNPNKPAIQPMIDRGFKRRSEMN